MQIKPYLRTAFILFILAGITTYLIARFVMTQKFESTAIIFPPNTHANIHLVSTGLRFGYDKEIGEQLEILNSTAVRNAMVEEFDLLSEYEVDTTKPYWHERLLKKYADNVTLSRTLNKSIEISVRDQSAERAAKMANRLVELGDEHLNNIVQENVRLAAHAAHLVYNEKAALIATMTDSLEALRLAGESVWTFGEERKSGRYQNYELQYRQELEHFHGLKLRWEELENLLKESVPKSYVVSTAIASGKPVAPRKGIMSLTAALLAALAYIALVQLKKK